MLYLWAGAAGEAVHMYFVDNIFIIQLFLLVNRWKAFLLLLRVLP
jgi:hypothetical protein